MLARIRKAMAEKEEGFTLIELLVVMIIIGILAAIAIPVFLSQRQKGYDASVKSDLRTIANELESYNTDQQNYPTGAISTGTGVTAGITTIGTDPTTVRTSSGNNFTYALDTLGVGAAGSAYCIVGQNSKGTHAWEYISSQGGLQPAGTFTAAVTATVPACGVATTAF
ncbi:MAG TPA: prepilin-type N-terminal cleavage/methylation domain-containing protein [Acidothermaceae bacterium]